MSLELTSEQAQGLYDLIESMMDALDLNDKEHKDSIKKLLNIME